jgi:hypothetical protein
MMGEVILDDLVPKPHHTTATGFGRGDHGKHRAAERHTSIASGVPVEPARCPDCPNQILYWEGWSSWQSELH